LLSDRSRPGRLTTNNLLKQLITELARFLHAGDRRAIFERSKTVQATRTLLDTFARGLALLALAACLASVLARPAAAYPWLANQNTGDGSSRAEPARASGRTGAIGWLGPATTSVPVDGLPDDLSHGTVDPGAREPDLPVFEQSSGVLEIPTLDGRAAQLSPAWPAPGEDVGHEFDHGVGGEHRGADGGFSIAQGLNPGWMTTIGSSVLAMGRLLSDLNLPGLGGEMGELRERELARQRGPAGRELDRAARVEGARIDPGMVAIQPVSSALDGDVVSMTLGFLVGIPLTVHRWATGNRWLVSVAVFLFLVGLLVTEIARARLRTARHQARARLRARRRARRARHRSDGAQASYEDAGVEEPGIGQPEALEPPTPREEQTIEESEPGGEAQEGRATAFVPASDTPVARVRRRHRSKRKRHRRHLVTGTLAALLGLGKADLDSKKSSRRHHRRRSGRGPLRT
jgi:hypothetical protein